LPESKGVADPTKSPQSKADPQIKLVHQIVLRQQAEAKARYSGNNDSNM
jgi:hypothetical protein